MVSKEYKDLKKFVEPPKEDKGKDKTKKYAKAVYKKLETIRNIFEDILNPDIGDLAISHEIRGLAIDIASIWLEYKRLMKAIRMYELAELLDSNELYEEFLGYSDEIIQDLVKRAKKILEDRLSFWDKNIEYKRPKEYLG
jgi:hypothetical protein